MLQSENLNELFTALSKAQSVGDREKESILCPKICKNFSSSFQKNGSKKDSILKFFFEKICFGVSDCWYWFGARDPGGYGLLKFDNENKAHRVSWTIFNGKIPEGMKVLHKCDVRNCVNPEHLFLGTQFDNVKDMISKGRDRKGSCPGEKNARAKLTEDQVIKMREKRLNENISYKKLAFVFGCSTMNAYRIVNRQLWRHV